MRKWRTCYKSLLVVPEVHGAFDSLEVILGRVLPLRFSIHQEDSLVFLGDYIDRGPDSDLVIDRLISLSGEQRIFMIKGNHEELLLKSLESEANYKYWISQGGHTTVLAYMKRAKLFEQDPLNFPQSRLRDIIPKDHIDFLKSLPEYLSYDNYYFVHSGFNYLSSFEETTRNGMLFDDSSAKYARNCIGKKIPITVNSQNVIVAAHNLNNKSPVITPRDMMLDVGAPQRLIVFDLNSMKCGMVKHGKSRIYDHKYQYVE